LAVDRILAAIDLEEGVLAVAIDLIAGRMFGWAFELFGVSGSPLDILGTSYLVPPRNVVRVHVLETELADVQDSVLAVLFGVWCGMPGLNFPAAKVDALNLTCRSCLLGVFCRFVVSI
jgi:hypothetical protein